MELSFILQTLLSTFWPPRPQPGEVDSKQPTGRVIRPQHRGEHKYSLGPFDSILEAKDKSRNKYL